MASPSKNQSLRSTLKNLCNRKKRRRMHDDDDDNDPIDRLAALAPTLLTTSRRKRATRNIQQETSEPSVTTKIEENSQEPEAASSEIQLDDTSTGGRGGGGGGGGENKEVQVKTAHEKESKLWLADIERYQQQLKEQQTEIQRIRDIRKKVYQQQVDLWGVYQYGLKEIAGLADLSDAPDAILPGNF